MPDRSEHVRYARLVLDEAIRRRLHELGTHVGQKAAALADVPSAAAGEHLQAALAAVGAGLGELAERHRVAASAGSPIAAALDPRPSPARSRAAAHVSAHTGDVDLPAAAADVSTYLRGMPLPEVEFRLLAAAMLLPAVREEIVDRLRPADFATRKIGATWGAIDDLRRRGAPVDVVLVAAEVERQGVHPDLGEGLRPAELLALHERGSDIYEGYSAAEVVVRAALGRVTAQAAGQLRDLGGNRGHSSGEALAAARASVRDVTAAVRRLTGAAPSAAAAALTPPAQRHRAPGIDALPPRTVAVPAPVRARRRG